MRLYKGQTLLTYTNQRNSNAGFNMQFKEFFKVVRKINSLQFGAFSFRQLIVRFRHSASHFAIQF